MTLSFILYKPGTPGNIGAAARALKTMGFNELRLIKPCDHLSDEAKMMAHGSRDILENARIYPDFFECIKDLDYVVGTTARKRTPKSDYITPREVHSGLLSKSEQVRRAGIIFGTEESGLPNEILLQCDVAATIPLVTTYPSLNLSQAVMLFAYELSGLYPGKKTPVEPSKESYSELKSRINRVMDLIDIPDEMPLRGRILERISRLDSDDLNLLHSVSSRIVKKLDK